MIGILVISHGSRSPEWVRRVDEAVRPIRGAFPYPVVSAFLEIVEGRLIQDGIDELEAFGCTELVVVPLFISSGSTHVEEIAWALGVKESCGCETELEPFRLRADVHLCAPIDADPDIIDVLYEKMFPLSRLPAQEAVLVVGHGSALGGFRDVWEKVLAETAEGLRARGGFAAADTVMLLPDQVQDKLNIWRMKRPELGMVVVPFFISEGYFTQKVIPTRFAGYDVRYNGRSLLPHPLVSRWMERRIAEKVRVLEKDDQESETHL